MCSDGSFAKNKDGSATRWGGGSTSKKPSGSAEDPDGLESEGLESEREISFRKSFDICRSCESRFWSSAREAKAGTRRYDLPQKTPKMLKVR